jgi:hypothetical protein
LRPPAFPERLLAHHRLELGYDAEIGVGSQHRINPALAGRSTDLQEALGLDLCEGRLDVLVGGSAPEPERIVERCSGFCGVSIGKQVLAALSRFLETNGVDTLRRRAEDVAAARGADELVRAGALALERLSEPGDVDAERAPSRRRRSIAPQLVDQFIGRHHASDARHERRQDRPLLGPGYREPPTILEGHLDGTKDEELHDRRAYACRRGECHSTEIAAHTEVAPR